MAWIRCTGNTGGSLKVRTASGAIASFETNLAEPLQSVKCSINPIQNDTPWIDSNVINKEPYIKRAVAGTATRIGNHLYDKLVGGTVAFNQIVPALSSMNSNCGYAVSNNVATCTLTESAVTKGRVEVARSYGFPVIPASNHKYLLSATIKSARDLTITSIYWGNDITLNKNIDNQGDWNTITGIVTRENPTGVYVQVYIRSDHFEVGDTVFIKDWNTIDLTAMFGSTIADYIYGLEQATAGAGVAFFKALFPNDYYAYNAGELMSVKATAHVMKNASNQVIGNYALDSNLELRGLFKLDANNKLYADGDTYESSGLVTRKYKPYTITSGTQIIGQTDLTTVTRYTFITDNEEPVISGGGVICVGLVKDNSYSGDYPHIYIDNTAQNKGRIYVFLPIGQAIGTINLVYELATPTTEQASPFTNPQVCDENGTEEYTDSRAVAIPVGHETYQANICPITGFDELNVGQSGINLWDEEWRNGFYREGTDGSFVSNASYVASNDYIPIKSSTTYYFTALSVVFVLYYRADNSYINFTRLNEAGTFTTPADCAFITFYCAATYGNTYNNDLSINYPATDTTYHAYNGSTVTIAFGQTVYGSVLDVTRGKLHVTHGKYTLDNTATAGQFDINTYTDRNRISYVPYQSDGKLDGTFKADKLETAPNAPGGIGTGDFQIFGSPTASRMWITVPTTIATVADFLTYISSNPIDVVYELATPFDIDLTPVQIEQLLGKNNVWHDCNGDTEVKYLYNA